MKIERLIIENFRQFRGRQEINFATAKGRNVTVIHADNGFGKTALLNALLWGFYGYDGLTEDLPKKDCILTESVALTSKRPADDCARVIIEFFDGEEHYTLTRCLTLSQQRNDPRKADLTLEIRREDGATVVEESPRLAQLKIDNLMPRGISQYLFFNGERIDHLAMERSAGDITDAIHQMLGLQLLQQTVADLEHPNVKGVLSRELRDNTDAETQSLLDEIEQLEKDVVEFQEKLELNKANQAANLREKKQIDANLAANEVARALQLERTAIETEVTQLEQQIGEQSRRLAALIAEQGYSLLAEPLSKEGEALAEALRQADKLPPKVNVDFVKDLLAGGRCLCGCDLKPGSDAYKAVEKWYAVAGDKSLSVAVSFLDKAIGAIRSSSASTRTALHSATKDRAALRMKLNKHRERLEDISAKLDEKEDDAVHGLNARREKLEREYHVLLGDERLWSRDLAEAKTDLEQKRAQLKDKKQKEKTAEQARRRLTAVNASIELLEQVLKLERDDLRVQLGEEIRRNFDAVKLKPEHWLELTPNFTLRLLKRTGLEGDDETIDVAHSTGERQLMSLVFMASLVALARRRSERPMIVQGLNGREFPLVMDSPFGQLGEDMRSGVAEWVPTLAPQVILLVTASQYKGEVEEKLTEGRRVGRRYLLGYHAKVKPEKAKKQVEINGVRHPQYFQSDSEFTEIQEIDR